MCTQHRVATGALEMTPHHQVDKTPPVRPPWREQGQTSIEYVVVCAALALALGVGMVDDTSVLKQLLEAFQSAYEKISFSLSLPT